MELDRLKKKVFTDDRDAFKEWMDVHIQAIERLAIVYGLSPRDAGEFAETIFGKLYNDRGQLSEEQLEEKALYKTVLRNLEEYQVEVSETGILPFEEDNKLHAQLIALPREERFIFILFRFHQKSVEDIAWITEKPIEYVNDLLQMALAKLNGPDIEKQLEFLHTSIQRLRPIYNERNIFYSTKKEALPIDEPIKKESRHKKTLLLWLGGSVMLILILSFTVVRSDAYQQSSAERFIEEKKISFQQELDERFELIGLPDPGGSHEFYFYGAAYIYGNETKQRFTSFVKKLEKQVENEGKINKKEATKKYDELIYELRLPSEMLEKLRREPIKDRNQSMEFLGEFAMKNDFLANAYMGVFGEHSDIIFGSELINDGMVDIEKLIEKKPEFPIELQNAVNGLETQFYSLAAIKDYVPLSLKYENPEVRETLQQNLHLDAEVYIFLIMGGLDVLQYGTYADKMDVLLELDKQLPKTRYSDPLVDRFDNGYSWLVFFMTGLTDGDAIYDRNMRVKEEVREKWRQLASIGDKSPAGLVMQEIVDEMEASNWTISFENDIHTQFFERVRDKINEMRERK